MIESYVILLDGRPIRAYQSNFVAGNNMCAMKLKYGKEKLKMDRMKLTTEEFVQINQIILK